MKKAILVVEILEIFDQQMYDKYIAQVPQCIQLYGGRYIALSNKLHKLEGEPPERCILIEFPSVEDARNLFSSDDYKAIKSFRENSTRSRGFLMEV
jgi:uncharacterized protein (DUF1330 family)